MKLIVGLGNPGLQYVGSRHNIGFEVVRYLAKMHKVTLKKEKGVQALSVKIRFDSLGVILALPLTYMNLSGEAVRHLLKKYKVAVSDLLVVYDDLDLEFGRIKIRSSGVSAGHRGVESIIGILKGRNDFNRIRIGIGRPSDKNASDFVLARFNRREKANLPGIIDRAAQCCKEWAEEGVDCAMNSFNRKDI
ncbi:MAG: Peptidyl-tRNA hydrolase [Candidatus Omnitrophica bacterium ADurb.Bin205]|nr:MAG: Peptidyl-tRNA hydrolase [Candidatus Omnitrophica bacterium ADurb.Bin205]